MQEYGIKMPPEKKMMLQSRLQRRLKALSIGSYSEYVRYLFSPEGMRNEVVHMMDVVSTNKTDFYRESAHFEFMTAEALPDLVTGKDIRSLNLWSAGSSSGEEAFTMAITLSEFMETSPKFDFGITATDISTKMLEMASLAIYSEEKIKEVPLYIKKKYFLKSKDPEAKKVRIVAPLRNKVNYFRQNLLELPAVSEPGYHIIFCRNVLIYFDRNNQYAILSKLCMNLKKGGYLFLGHSESITGFSLPLQQIKPTIFRKK